MNRLKTRCAQGHTYTPENTYYRNTKKPGMQHRSCRACLTLMAANKRRKTKAKVIAGYGGKCNWPLCDITDPDLLVLDHVNDDGYKERGSGYFRKAIGDSIYRKAIRLGFPETYQILCANHNLKKEILRKHEKVQAKIDSLKSGTEEYSELEIWGVHGSGWTRIREDGSLIREI